MYKIRIDNIKLTGLVSNYLTSYRDKLRDEINGFLRGNVGFVFGYSVGRDSTKKRFRIEVDKNPNSFTRQFLEECSDPNNPLLDSLLIGDINVQLKVIEKVLKDSAEHFEKLTAGKAKKKGYSDGDTVDDFNAILYEIFVKRSFDGDTRRVHALKLDKDDFVKNLGIRICPYCGRSYIYRVEKAGKGGDVAVKPQIDHFLPKSKYPFLGMNFYNLIPCCTQCNMAPCKEDNDPLDATAQKVTYLMYPYDFDDNRVRFTYRMKAPDTYNPESFDVLVGYENKDMKKGYNGFLAIDKLYAGHSVEICNMHLRARALRIVSNGFYKGLGMAGFPIALFAQGVLGYYLTPVEENRQLMYKFNRDIFRKIVSKPIKPATKYYADYGGKEIEVHIG